MRLLSDYQQYEDCLTRLQLRGIKPVTNCPLLPDTVRERIAQGALYCEELDRQVLFLNSMGQFYQLYYFGAAATSTQLPSLPQDKPILLSFIYSRKTMQIEEDQALWHKRGFRAYKTAQRMTKKINADSFIEPSENIQPLDEEHLSQVEQGLVQWFDPIGDLVPTHEEMLRIVKEKRLLGILNKNEQVVAFLSFECEAKVLTIIDIAVDPTHRSMGIGGQLLQYLSQVGLNSGARYIRSWVNQGNKNSERLHLRIGFQFDGKISEKFILNMEES